MPMFAAVPGRCPFPAGRALCHGPGSLPVPRWPRTLHRAVLATGTGAAARSSLAALLHAVVARRLAVLAAVLGRCPFPAGRAGTWRHAPFPVAPECQVVRHHAVVVPPMRVRPGLLPRRRLPTPPRPSAKDFYHSASAPAEDFYRVVLATVLLPWRMPSPSWICRRLGTW